MEVKIYVDLGYPLGRWTNSSACIPACSYAHHRDAIHADLKMNFLVPDPQGASQHG
jgi:hypothetical protein